MFEELKWDCLGDGVKYKKIVEKERFFKFLLGLNKNLDEVRGRVLSLKPLPSVREAISEVRRKESRKKIILRNQGFNSTTTNPINDNGFALIAHGVNSQNNDNRTKKGRPW